MSEIPWRRPDGQPFDVHPISVQSSWPIESPDRSIWRYRGHLPVDPESIVSLGEGGTPLVDGPRGMSMKCDFLMPSGSFKDRGSSVLVSGLRSAGVEEMLLDSSGNAGASMAMYAAVAGIRCEVLVPASTPEAKTRQAEAHGATVTRIEGTREEVALTARELAETRVYASHNWQPLFVHGTKTLAYELVEQHRNGLPDHIVLPVGYGSLLMGLHLGFRELAMAGVLTRMPRLHAAQASACAPLVLAFQQGADRVDQVESKPTIASAIASSAPIRGPAMLAALTDSNGSAVAVAEPDIAAARVELSRAGFYVEPSSAVAFAAACDLRDEGVIGDVDDVVVVLTGSGLKD